MAHFFGILLLIYTVYLARPGFALFSWHPTLMVLSFGVLMLEAILMFSPYSSLVPKTQHKERVRYHWIFQVSSVITAFLGFIAIFQHKERNKKNPVHFASWHSIFGLAAIILSGVNCLGGLVFLLACATMVLSLYSNWFKKAGGEFVWYAMLALITVLASVVTNQTSSELIFKKKTDGN
eukprot:gene5942-6632_t